MGFEEPSTILVAFFLFSFFKEKNSPSLIRELWCFKMPGAERRKEQLLLDVAAGVHIQ